MTDSKSPSPSRRTFVQGTAAAAAASTLALGRSAHAAPEDGAAAKNPTLLKIATVAPAGTPWAKQMKKFKKECNKESNGELKCKTYFGGALGGERETVEACKRGTIQIFAGTLAAVTSIVDELGVFDLPYLFKNEKAADRIFDEVIYEDLDALLWERGFKLLFLAENGYRGIGSKFDCHKPADLVGRKMRSQQTDVHLNTWSAMGASPVPLSVTEVLTALQTGVVDGFDNTPLFAFAASWYQGITHYAPTNHIYQAGCVLASRKFYEPLPDAHKAIIMGDPAKRTKKGRRGVRAMKELLLANFSQSGVSVAKMSDADRKPFAEATRKVWDTYRKETSKAGKAMYDKIVKAI